MITRFGPIQIERSHPYSQNVNGFAISPLLQDKLLILAQELPYSTAHQIARQFLGKTVSRSSLYRLTMHYGQAIAPALAQAPEPVESPDEVVYAMADGLMLLVDEGYKETKLGRIFSRDALVVSPVADRGGQIGGSAYVAQAGSWPEFWAVWQVHLAALVAQGKQLVFLSDGVVWLHEQLKESYPQAVLILDIYHVMEHLAQAAQAGVGSVSKRKAWLESMRNLLLTQDLDEVIGQLASLPIEKSLRERITNYLLTNRHRMDYRQYLDRGLCIGSGAIESANKSVVQARLKRSGQRWSKLGAQRVLNLRTCWMSGRWALVDQQITPEQYAMAA